MFNSSPLRFLASQNIPADSSLVHQLRVDLLYDEFPVLKILWESYKHMTMSYLSDILVSRMSDHIFHALELSPELLEFSQNISSSPAQLLNHYRYFESQGLSSIVLKDHIASWNSSAYWMSLGRCFRFVNPHFKTASGDYVSYPLYYNSKSVLAQYDASSLEVRGNFFYPPGGFREWHTNSINPGWRAYCVFSDESSLSSFNYINPASGSLSIVHDKSDHVNLFRVATSDQDSLWHSVQSSTWRLSMGFRFNIQIQPEEIESYILARDPATFLAYNRTSEWEWWIRLPFWCSKSAVGQFLKCLAASDSSSAISVVHHEICRHNQIAPPDWYISDLMANLVFAFINNLCANFSDSSAL